mgnify:CR=1 FL=1
MGGQPHSEVMTAVDAARRAEVFLPAHSLANPTIGEREQALMQHLMQQDQLMQQEAADSADSAPAASSLLEPPAWLAAANEANPDEMDWQGEEAAKAANKNQIDRAIA